MGNEAICRICESGYILSKTNNKCIKISENKELTKFDNCDELTLDNNNYYCSRCSYPYSLLNYKNEKKCVYLPTMNSRHYLENYSPINYEYEYDKKDLYDIYLYNMFYLNPCQEAINLGTEDLPLYSCTKCLKYFENELIDIFETIVLIKDIKTNINYCIEGEQYHLYSCEEAIMEINGKEMEFNCIKCKKD